jgi:hypothetical protein
VFAATPKHDFSHLATQKHHMSIAERFMLLPPAIDYAGFTFRLQFTEHSQYGIGIAFVLTGCHSRKKYKRLAWKQGYWEDKSPQRQISTMFSNYLFYEPLFDTSDTSLSQALQNLHQRLLDYKLLHPAVYRRAFDTGNLICSPIKLLEE